MTTSPSPSKENNHDESETSPLMNGIEDEKQAEEWNENKKAQDVQRGSGEGNRNACTTSASRTTSASARGGSTVVPVAAWGMVRFYVAVVALDVSMTLVLGTPLLPWFHPLRALQDKNNSQHHEDALQAQAGQAVSPYNIFTYSLCESLWDVTLLAALRLLESLRVVLCHVLCRCRPCFGCCRPRRNASNDENNASQQAEEDVQTIFSAKYAPKTTHHPNGEPKSRDELDEEALEEDLWPFFKRFLARPTLPMEVLCTATLVYLLSKSLARLYVQLSLEQGDIPQPNIGLGLQDENDNDADAHGGKNVWWWLYLAGSALCTLIEQGTFVRAVKRLYVNCQHARKKREQHRRQRQRLRDAVASASASLSGNDSCHSGTAAVSSAAATAGSNSDLTTPLLANDGQEALEEDVELAVAATASSPSNKSSTSSSPSNTTTTTNTNNNDVTDQQAISDITGDSAYKAKWYDLLHLCLPDLHLIAMAFLFLLAAALAQVYVPHFAGRALDALVDTHTDNDTNYDNTLNDNTNNSIWSAAGFIQNIEYLVIASILGGIFSGIRGSIFTVVGANVNVRLRMLLMESLLQQEIGFYDVTKTGNITSRLCSDTTLVGDQVTLNVNVFLRSLVQAVGVLIFMFFISWQLTLLAFLSVPVITVFSKMYGEYLRRMAKLMQKKLADGNTVSEAVLSSMSTVRSFGAEANERAEYQSYLKTYLHLNLRSAFAYFGYAALTTALPQLVIAVVLFYGGLLVRSEGPDHISSGQLVSFLLYLQSLSDAFAYMGGIFSSLTQAVGAADKVFELMNRKPKMRAPEVTAETTAAAGNAGRRASSSRSLIGGEDVGLRPSTCLGQVTLHDVDMFYPARPKRQVLNKMSMVAPPGAVVALVGPSGGGKSSVVSLIQRMYDPAEGSVCIDGNEVHNLNREWLTQNVSAVSQEPTLFGRSIKRNIIFGLENTPHEPTDEEIYEAARLANASDFIEQLPLGYETDVGERGVQLSGGQKQRIAIARALVRKPRILLLDEATSALDAESEATVQEAIDGMLTRGRKGKKGPIVQEEDGKDPLKGEGQVGNGGTSATPNSMTVIIVAHRLSTVRNADIIYVVEAGKVVEQGCHDDLIQNTNGAYYNLISRQIKAQEQLENGGAAKGDERQLLF